MLNIVFAGSITSFWPMVSPPDVFSENVLPNQIYQWRMSCCYYTKIYKCCCFWNLRDKNSDSLK